MAFTPDQLLSFNDLVTLVNEEGYFVKNSFTPSTELVTKEQIIDALWLDGNPPLYTYVYNQHVRYEDIAPLGTVWVGDSWECVDSTAPVNQKPTPPTIVEVSKTETTITVDWTAQPGTDDVGIVGYTLYYLRVGALIPAYVGVDIGNVLTHTLQGLRDGEEYRIYVTAYDIEPLESDASNILAIITDEAPGTPVFTDPYNLTRMCSADEIIKVAWQPAVSDQGIDYHTVYYRTGTAAWSSVNVSNENNVEIDGLSIALYEVYVTATNYLGQVSGPTSTIEVEAISLSGTIRYYEPATLDGYEYLWQHRGIRSGTELTLAAPDSTDSSGINKCIWYDYPENENNFTLTKTFYESENIDGKSGNVGSGSEFWYWPFNFQICVVGDPLIPDPPTDEITFYKTQDSGVSNGATYWVNAPEGDTISFELVIHTAGVSSPEWDWIYRTISDSDLYDIAGYVPFTYPGGIPYTHTWDIVSDGFNKHVMTSLADNPSSDSYYGLATATLTITNTTGVGSIPPPLNADITGGDI